MLPSTYYLIVALTNVSICFKYAIKKWLKKYTFALFFRVALKSANRVECLILLGIPAGIRTLDPLIKSQLAMR
jgi:hypothetical protein